ncbi:hypothetical protein [Streptomyces sp. NPDC005336]|uniref:hypothetical protein n=1 Tax=Streptomyces sp. NPDC005336 TaxID=3157035 RepID=UPI0033A694F0
MNPHAVRAAAQAPVHDMTPGELSSHLARVGALRSQLQGDVARSPRMPLGATARLRSVVNPAEVHSLRAERSSAVREMGRRHQPPTHLQAHRRPPSADQSGPRRG